MTGKYIILKKNLIVYLLFPFVFNGCSEVYRYQPPAPVYGNNQTSNPYEKPPQVKTQPLENSSRYSTPQKDYQTGSSKNSVPDTQINTYTAVKPLSPAVLALVSEADRNSKAGNLDSAVSTIERALRIDSRNPTLTYKLAKLRLKQSKPRLAEDLAKKAALLSANNRQLRKQSWLLISEARRQQQNYFGAKEAKLKADSI